MADSTAAPADTAATESKTSNKEQSFLARLVEFGDQIIPAERPAFEDVGKVLGALIHWIDQGGGFEAPEAFNPALSQAVAEQEAEQSRLAAQNAELSTRLASLETLMRQQIASQPAAPAAPVEAAPVTPAPVADPAVPGEGAAPVAPAPVAPAPVDTPAPVVPGVSEPAPVEPVPVVAPPEAAAPPVAPAPPVSE